MIATVILAIILAAALYALIRRKSSSSSRLPGPRGWPLIGNTFQFDPHYPQLTAAKWAKRYGDLFAVRFVNENWVFLNSYDNIIEMLIRKGADYAGRNVSYRVALSTENGRGLVFNQPSDWWKSMKKSALTGIKIYSSERGSKMESYLTELLDDSLADLNKYGDRSFDIRENLYNFAIKSILTITIGERIDDGDPFFAMIQEIDHISARSLNVGGTGTELDIFPWLRFFGNMTYRNLAKSVMLTDDFWAAVYPAISERFERQERSCVVHNMMESLCNKQLGTVDQQVNVKMAALDLIVAGSYTTVTSLYAYFNILLHHPEVKRRLHEEVDREVGQSRRVRLEDRDSLPYTQATILELLRYTSIAPFGVPHVALKTSTINGQVIQEGTTLMVNGWYLHHDETFWKDPWTFDPGRFLDANGRVVPPDHDNRKHLMPFGAGIRMCPGEALVLSRIFLISASILQRFDIRADDPNHLVSCDPCTYELGLVLHPTSYKIKISSRT